MSHFEIFVTAYSALSTIGMGLTVYYGRKFVLATEKRAKLLALEALEAVESTVKAHVTAELRPLHVRMLDSEMMIKSHAVVRADEIKADIARVEKWITDHAEELKNRAEDLRVRALDLHDKNCTTATRQPPTR